MEETLGHEHTGALRRILVWLRVLYLATFFLSSRVKRRRMSSWFSGAVADAAYSSAKVYAYVFLKSKLEVRTVFKLFSNFY